MEYSSSKKARLPGISFGFGGGSGDSEEDDYYSEDGSLTAMPWRIIRMTMMTMI